MTGDALGLSHTPWAQGLDSKDPSHSNTVLYSLQKAFPCLIPIHPLRGMRRQRGDVTHLESTAPEPNPLLSSPQLTGKCSIAHSVPSAGW